MKNTWIIQKSCFKGSSINYVINLGGGVGSPEKKITRQSRRYAENPRDSAGEGPSR